MQNLQILPATLAHAALLAQLSSKTFYDTYAHANTKEDMEQYISENFTEEEIAQEINETHTFLFIAFSNGISIGYIKLGTATSPEQLDGKLAMEIERVYVVKEFQSKNIGAALLKHAISFARETKVKVLWLGVWKNNFRAIKFYEREGFKKFGTKIFTLGRDLQEDFMMKMEL